MLGTHLNPHHSILAQWRNMQLVATVLTIPVIILSAVYPLSADCGSLLPAENVLGQITPSV